MSDIGVSDIGWCRKVTDIGVSAIAHNCPLLKIIDLAECKKITDVGV